jgi:branched-chain amino acid transport system substrate-binding protein
MKRAGPIVLAACLSASASTFGAEIPVKIGVLTDLSGPYASLSGEGSVIATSMRSR